MKLAHQHPFLDPHNSDHFVAFAHRGGACDHPENSMQAFMSAWRLGFRYLETDVQLTQDGTVVAFHDTNLLRTCGVDVDIEHLRKSDLPSVLISGKEPIPILSDLLEAFPEAYFNLDAKSDAVVQPLVDLLRRTNNLDRVCIGSFSHGRLARIRSDLGPSVCTSASPLEVLRWMIGLFPSGPSCLQVPLRQSVIPVTTASRIRRSRELGLPIHVWTIDEPSTMQSLIDLGVDGIMTDDLQTLRDVAMRNQKWRSFN